MKQKVITLYSFQELSEDAKDKAIERLYDINVNFEWWEYTYEDAKRIGIKITGFDLGSRFLCEGNIITSHRKIAEAILKEHGENCETYKTSEAFLKERDSIVYQAQKNEDGEFENEYQLDLDLGSCEEEYLKSILEDYRMILQGEYEYLTSREAIIETIEANEYTFTRDGKLEN